MDNIQLKSMVLASFALSTTTITRLYLAKKITAREAAEIYEQALLLLETFQEDAPGSGEAFRAARQHLETAIQEIRTALLRDESSPRRD